jgi:type I restriction enzyme M protein
VAKLTQSELETHLWKAADILRGHVDAGKFKDYIFGLLFYKRLCDVWEEEFEVLLAETGDREEAAEPDEHRFHVPAEHRWDAVRKHSTQIGQHLNNAFAAIEDKNLRLRGVFGDIDFANQERFPDARLEALLAHFEKHRLRNADVPADMLGDAYMYLIKQFADSAGKSGGEFYTPRQVVRLIVECLQPQPGMSIYDPTCGSGGMLLEAVQYVKDHGGNARSLSLFGQEKELDTWSIAEINLFLHDIDDAFIAKGDTLLAPRRYDPKTKEFVAGVGAYDRVMANPPFSAKEWGHEIWSNGDPFGRDKYGCPPKGYGDLAFVQHMIASLKPGGLLGVVVPDGMLFRGGGERTIREKLVRADLVEAVIGLAPNIFYGADAPTSILIINASKPDHARGRVLIVNGEEKFAPGRARNALSDEDVQCLVTAYQNRAEVPRLATVVTTEQIADLKFNLSPNRYVPLSSPAESHEPDVLISAFEAECAALNASIGDANQSIKRLFDTDWSIDAPRTRKLGEMAQLISGQHIPAADYNTNGDGVPYLTGPSDFPNGKIKTTKYTKSPRVMCAEGDILITVKGSGVGKTTIADRAYCISRQLMAIRPAGVDSQFLYEVIQSIVKDLNEQAGGPIPGITRDDILSKDVLIYPEAKQSMLGGDFTSIRRLIETLSNQAAILEKLRLAATERVLGRVE